MDVAVYRESNLRVLTLAPFQHLNMLDPTILEFINDLLRIYNRLQNRLLVVLGHAPGREL